MFKRGDKVLYDGRWDATVVMDSSTTSAIITIDGHSGPPIHVFTRYLQRKAQH